MKQVRAIAKNVRSTPRKTRIPASAVRGMKAVEALDVLKYMPKKAAHDVRKVVASAIANAVNNEGMDAEKLIISKIQVNDGFTMKRFRPESKGRVRAIMKRNSHIEVYVTDGSAVETKTETKKAEAKVETKKEAKPAAKKEEKVEKKTTKKATKTTTKKVAKKTTNSKKDEK